MVKKVELGDLTRLYLRGLLLTSDAKNEERDLPTKPSINLKIDHSRKLGWEYQQLNALTFGSKSSVACHRCKPPFRTVG